MLSYCSAPRSCALLFSLRFFFCLLEKKGLDGLPREAIKCQSDYAAKDHGASWNVIRSPFLYYVWLVRRLYDVRVCIITAWVDRTVISKNWRLSIPDCFLSCCLPVCNGCQSICNSLAETLKLYIITTGIYPLII